MPLTSGWQAYCLKAAEQMKDDVGVNFDMVTASGISGQCVAFYVAVALKIPFLLVRKEPTKSGGYGIKRTYVSDGDIGLFYKKHGRPPKVCFVDDWIASGGTRRDTCSIIHQYGGDCVYEYLYADRDGRRKILGKIAPGVYESFGKVIDPRTGMPYKPPVAVRAARAVKAAPARARVATKKPAARKTTTKAIPF